MNEWLNLDSDNNATSSIIRCSTIDSVRFQALIDEQGRQVTSKHQITGEILPVWQVTVLLPTGGHQLTFIDEQKARDEYARICNEVRGTPAGKNKGLN